MGIKNFSLRSVGSYLQENIYYIPDYQREYSWDVDNEIDDFWMDLESVTKEDREQHFFGQVVIHDSCEEKKKYIIDGQQRTSTSVILLCVLNRLFDSLNMDYGHKGAKNRTEDIRTKYIGRWEEEEDELRLHLGKIDREYFKKYIQVGQTEENSDKLLKSHQRILNAYKYFEIKLKEKLSILDEVEDKYNILFKYYKKLIEGFTVMYVETDDINEAFIIFETLNARGKDLETSDLLKNHLFRVSGKGIHMVKSKWQEMIDNLDKIDATRYIRHYWNSRDEFVREKDLYKRIRNKIDTPKKCEELVTNLLELSDIYKAMVNANDETFFSDSELNQTLYNLKTIKASSFYPIILAMRNMNYSEKDIGIVAKSIENLVVRNFVIAGRVANKYEVIFAEIAYGIYEKQYVCVDDMIEKIKKNTIKDDEFKAAFSMLTIKSKPVIRYLLRTINNILDKETQIINDNKKIHIEHIMPENNEIWKVTKEEHEENLWKIGNLTLLGCEYNRANSNKSFEYKKKIYNKSSILISKELAEYKDWNKVMIQKRQEELAELALKAWRL